MSFSVWRVATHPEPGGALCYAKPVSAVQPSHFSKYMRAVFITSSNRENGIADHPHATSSALEEVLCDVGR